MTAATPLPHPHIDPARSDEPISPEELEAMQWYAERASRLGFAGKTRDDAITTLRELEVAHRHTTVALTSLVAHVENKRSGQRGTSTSQIISEIRQLPTKDADRFVKHASRLSRFPDVVHALAIGYISEANAKTICHTADECWPFLDDDGRAAALKALIEDARFCLPAAFRDRCRSFLDEIDLQGARTRAQQDEKIKRLSDAKRFLVFEGDDLRGYSIRGHLPGSQAAPLLEAIEREATKIWRMKRRRGEAVPGEATRNLDALVAIARRSNPNPPPNAGPSAPNPDAGPSAGPNGPTVDALPSAGPSAGPHPELPHNELSHDELPLDIEPDAYVPTPAPDTSAAPGTVAPRATPDQTKPQATPEYEDPRRRLVGPKLRAFLIQRDGGCVVPWCDMPPRTCDGHHIQAFNDGGPTTADSIALLCPRHHAEFENPPGTKHGWTIRLVNGLPAAIPPVAIDPNQLPLLHPRLRGRISPARE